MAKKKIEKLSDLTPDQQNFNRHTEFGTKLLEDSLRKFGAGRSILVDKDGNIIAGNGVTETAASIGMEDVIVVPSDGKKLVVVQRTDIDLDSPEGRELALADNMTALKGIDMDLEKVRESLGDDLAKAWGLMNSLEVNPEDYGDQFLLPDDDKPKSNQITFYFSLEQKSYIEKIIAEDLKLEETFGNDNANGNKLYTIVKQWADARK